MVQHVFLGCICGAAGTAGYAEGENSPFVDCGRFFMFEVFPEDVEKWLSWWNTARISLVRATVHSLA